MNMSSSPMQILYICFKTYFQSTHILISNCHLIFIEFLCQHIQFVLIVRKTTLIFCFSALKTFFLNVLTTVFTSGHYFSTYTLWIMFRYTVRIFVLEALFKYEIFQTLFEHHWMHILTQVAYCLFISFIKSFDM